MGNSLEEYAFNIFEYEKDRTGSDYFNRTIETDNSSDKRSNFKKANKPTAFEIFVIPEVMNEEDSSNYMTDGRSRDMSSQNTSSDNIKSSSFDKVKRYFTDSKKFRAFDKDQEKQQNNSLEIGNKDRDTSERMDKSTITENTESNAKERVQEDKLSGKEDSFKRMMDDQIHKYEQTHEKGFFLTKTMKDSNNKIEDNEQLDDSNEAPVKDFSYDFFKDPSSQTERSKHKTSDASEIGMGSSDHRAGSFRLNGSSENPRFIDLGKFNSFDSSKNSENTVHIYKQPVTHSTSVGPKIKNDGR